MSVLRLVYKAEDEHHGELYASVEVPGFSGSSSAWFTRDALIEFCDRLNIFPIPKDPAVLLAGGEWEVSNLKRVCFGLEIRPFGHTGSLLAKVELSSQTSSTASLAFSQHAVLQFLTHYTLLEQFSSTLRRAIHGKNVSVELVGTSS